MTYDSIIFNYDNLELSFEVFLRISWASDNRRPGPIPMLSRRKPPEASAESRAKRCCGSTWQGCELLGVGIGLRKSERKKLWSMVTWHEMTWNDMKWHEMTWNDMKWHEMTWNDMKWHEITWKDMTCNDIINIMKYAHKSVNDEWSNIFERRHFYYALSLPSLPDTRTSAQWPSNGIAWRSSSAISKKNDEKRQTSDDF